MKRTFILVLAAALLGCNVTQKTERPATVDNNTADHSAAAATPASSAQAAPSTDEAQKILGSYVGSFGDNKITLLITKVDGTNVSGRTIVGGNDRPFDG